MSTNLNMGHFHTILMRAMWGLTILQNWRYVILLFMQSLSSLKCCFTNKHCIYVIYIGMLLKTMFSWVKVDFECYNFVFFCTFMHWLCRHDIVLLFTICVCQYKRTKTHYGNDSKLDNSIPLRLKDQCYMVMNVISSIDWTCAFSFWFTLLQA